MTVVSIKRFQSGHDGVIQHISQTDDINETIYKVIISVVDAEVGWINLQLMFMSVKRFVFPTGPGCYQIITAVFSFDWFGEELYFSFELGPHYPHNENHYENSEFFVVGNECFWEILPYQEYHGDDVGLVPIPLETQVDTKKEKPLPKKLSRHSQNQLPSEFISLRQDSLESEISLPNSQFFPHLFNVHLLQIDLSVAAYEVLLEHWLVGYPNVEELYTSQLPAYTVSRCPICLEENVERLNTYSIHHWERPYFGQNVFGDRGIINHCNHFTLVESFFHFHGLWPSEAKGLFGPEKPCVKAHLLNSNQCVAVIHALPVCLIEQDKFIPSYTLFIVSYFSERPKEAYEAVISYNVQYLGEPVVPSAFLGGCLQDDGDVLEKWVSAGQLFWLDGDDPSLGIQTQNTDTFPYKNISGRTYEHRFPYPLPKLRETGVK